MKKNIFVITCFVGCMAVLTACGGGSDDADIATDVKTETVSEYQTILSTAMNDSFFGGSYFTKFGAWGISSNGFRVNDAIYVVEVYVTGNKSDPTTTKDCSINILIYKNGSLYTEFAEQKCDGSSFNRTATSETSGDGYVIYDVTVNIPSIKDKKGGIVKGLTYKCHTTLENNSMLTY